MVYLPKLQRGRSKARRSTLRKRICRRGGGGTRKSNAMRGSKIKMGGFFPRPDGNFNGNSIF